MIILVNSGSGGLANYLINGTHNSRDQEKIEVLDGDLKLTEKISYSLKYKDKHYHMILSIEGKKTNDKMSEIYQDFKKELLDAYRDDEINISAVLHQDTDNSHIHVMIPKKNLLTNTKLDLYFDKRDRKRFASIRDYLDIKHQLKSPDNKLSNEDKLNSQTKNWVQDNTIIKTKKQKIEFEKKLMSFVNQNINSLKSNEELVKFINDKTNVNITKCGYDYKNDKYYATVEHAKSGTKQRIFNPLFNNGKSKYTTNNDGEKIYEKSNFNKYVSDFEMPNFSDNALKKARKKLDIENDKYRKYIDSRIGNSRKKALLKLDKQNQQSAPTPTPINNKKTDPIINNKTNNRKENKLDTFLSKDSKLYKYLEKINKIDIGEIASKFFDYKTIFISDNLSHKIIYNKNTNSSLFVYKDKDNLYNYVDPFTKLQGQTTDFLLQILGLKSFKVSILKPFIEFGKTLDTLILDLLLPISIDLIFKAVDKFVLDNGSNNTLLNSKDEISINNTKRNYPTPNLRR